MLQFSKDLFSSLIETPEFKLIDGKQVWTILLRKGVMFHAGPKTEPYELTADDVVFSLNKSKDKKYRMETCSGIHTT